MSTKKSDYLFIPNKTTKSVGTKFPKDSCCHKNKDSLTKVTLTMPDGMTIRVPIYEEESLNEKIDSYLDNWFKMTKDEPEKFGHSLIKDKCPKCGGELRYKLLQQGQGSSVWCINHPNCNYQTFLNKLDTRKLIYKKHGLKTVWGTKSGICVVFSNKPPQKNK